jgi:hypothetical protein
MTHEEIAERLPDGSLLLPLDEVIPRSARVADARRRRSMSIRSKNFPSRSSRTLLRDDAGENPRSPRRPCRVRGRAGEPADTAEHVDEAEMVDSDVVAADQSVQPELEDSEPERPTYQPAALAPPEPERHPEPARSDQARRIAALLTPLLNGLEIGQRDGAGTTVVTVIAPTLSEDSVVRTAMRIVPFLSDARLPEPVTQATLTAAGTTIVLTPFGSADTGRALS